MLNIWTDDQGVIHLEGRFDASQVPSAQQTFQPLNGSQVFDCAELEYISSAGIGVLLELAIRLRSGGHGIRVTNANQYILRVFEYAGLRQVFQIG